MTHNNPPKLPTPPHRHLPFTLAEVKAIAAVYPTPFHIYDEAAIRAHARELYAAFSWVPGGFKNYFAVKALPNPHILRVLREEGMGADCSSLAELVLAAMAGIGGEDIMFSSNNTPAEDMKKARELGAIINLDDISHIPFLEEVVGIPDRICFRYNPGSLKARSESMFIGNPEDAKYGLTRDQLFDAYATMRDKGVKRFGLHTMVASNELNGDAFVETATMLFDLVVELSHTLNITFEFVNLGGGIGIPYRPGEVAPDLAVISAKIHRAYTDKIEGNGLVPLRVVMENRDVG